LPSNQVYIQLCFISGKKLKRKKNQEAVKRFWLMKTGANLTQMPLILRINIYAKKLVNNKILRINKAEKKRTVINKILDTQ
jgi:hypothetical protein